MLHKRGERKLQCNNEFQEKNKAILLSNGEKKKQDTHIRKKLPIQYFITGPSRVELFPDIRGRSGGLRFAS